MSEEITQNQNQERLGVGGVKTEEGKAISKYNAQKHSILRESVSDYEKVNYEEVFNDLSADLKPEGIVQEKMVEIIALNFIKMQRVARAEADLIREAFSPVSHSEVSKYEMYYTAPATKEFLAPISSKIAPRLELFSRYQTMTENRLYRALIAFKQLKNNV